MREFSVRLRLLALRIRKNRLSLFFWSRMFTRAMSPPLGSSSLITSAPRKPRICVQAGPAWLCVMSMMRMPDRALSMVALRTEWDDRVLAIGADYGSVIHEECHDGP